ncbi:MAG: prepilin-type N-terminal cleavage/methylation domain-containing protein [Puniceicoccaceae bacterium]|nr:MAG: prepilin-type N-terminal cleavage/methylation domain-containing protein [Puniceicoccaceae bacterium]
MLMKNPGYLLFHKEGSVLINRQSLRSTNAGMSLVEVLISVAVGGLVIAAGISSTLFFAKIASNHEYRAQFNQDVRMGLETMTQDIRNARSISQRWTDGFSLDGGSGTTVYTFEPGSKSVIRTSNGNSQAIFNHVADFSILTSAADASGNPNLEFSTNTLVVKTLEFQARRGTAPEAKLGLRNFTFTQRNTP